MAKEILELPEIPDKRYFSIGEVSRLCLIKPHVLRYWEQEFSHINPSKRMGRRYYQVNDILIIRQIRTLLYLEGFTISGAKQQLKSKKEINKISSHSDTLVQPAHSELIAETISELESLLQEII